METWNVWKLEIDQTQHLKKYFYKKWIYTGQNFGVKLLISWGVTGFKWKLQLKYFSD